MSNKSTKTITMDYNEFIAEMQEAQRQGLMQGDARGMSMIMRITLDIIKNNSENIDLFDNGAPEIIKFVHEIQEALGQEKSTIKVGK